MNIICLIYINTNSSDDMFILILTSVIILYINNNSSDNNLACRSDLYFLPVLKLVDSGFRIKHSAQIPKTFFTSDGNLNFALTGLRFSLLSSNLCVSFTLHLKTRKQKEKKYHDKKKRKKYLAEVSWTLNGNIIAFCWCSQNCPLRITWFSFVSFHD